jgi:hypothetical protein
VFASLHYEIAVCVRIISHRRCGDSAIEPRAVVLLALGMLLATHLLLPTSVLLPTGLCLPTPLVLSAVVLYEFVLLRLHSPSLRDVSLRPVRLRHFLPSWSSHRSGLEGAEIRGVR